MDKKINIEQAVSVFFLKNARPKKLKNQHWLFDNRTNKNEAINIIAFK